MRRRPRRSRGDEGVTLVELLVALGISSLLVAMIATMFITTSRAFSDQKATIGNSQIASTAMNEVTRIIRAGTEIPVYGSSINNAVFTYAGAERIVMASFIDAESSVDPAPLQVEFSRNAANELVEQRWAAYHVHTTYWQFQTTLASSRTIARSLVAPVASQPLFRYLDKSGTELAPSAGASLTATQIRNIASVQVTMQVQGDRSGRVPPVQIQNLVGLPNLGVARVEVN